MKFSDLGIKILFDAGIETSGFLLNPKIPAQVRDDLMSNWAELILAEIQRNPYAADLKKALEQDKILVWGISCNPNSEEPKPVFYCVTRAEYASQLFKNKFVSEEIVVFLVVEKTGTTTLERIRDKNPPVLMSGVDFYYVKNCHLFSEECGFFASSKRHIVYQNSSLPALSGKGKKVA